MIVYISVPTNIIEITEARTSYKKKAPKVQNDASVIFLVSLLERWIGCIFNHTKLKLWYSVCYIMIGLVYSVVEETARAANELLYTGTVPV
jgi:VanZ family protein